eukprot:TRINITY_DN973_c0_g1_i1.p1 TRINITY_DN973_c0_g1~~TRINITY_DN973_c0_g1_i1.p1  ORF type:complete len:237 (+),score=43.15 TRINITY_DN973_c0_g1_i1:31-741(+)
MPKVVKAFNSYAQGAWAEKHLRQKAVPQFVNVKNYTDYIVGDITDQTIHATNQDTMATAQRLWQTYSVYRLQAALPIDCTVCAQKLRKKSQPTAVVVVKQERTRPSLMCIKCFKEKQKQVPAGIVSVSEDLSAPPVEFKGSTAKPKLPDRLAVKKVAKKRQTDKKNGRKRNKVEAHGKDRGTVKDEATRAVDTHTQKRAEKHAGLVRQRRHAAIDKLRKQETPADGKPGDSVPSAD